MKWFKHDSDSHRDDKLEKVLMKYGSDGYALYWLCLEIIAAPIDKHNLTFELKHDAEILGYRLKIDTLRVEEIMRFMIDLNLFEINPQNQCITCLKLSTRIVNSIVKNPGLKLIQAEINGQNINNCPRQSGIIRDNRGKVGPDTDTDTDTDTDIDQKKKKGRFTKPTIELLKKYIDENNLVVDAETFFYFYESKNWYVGKNKMVKWKSCLQTWHKKQWEKDNGQTQRDTRTRAQKVVDKLDEIARQDIEENGITEFLD